MRVFHEAITGTNPTPPPNIDRSIYEVLHNFYRAFNFQDLELMQSNWQQDHESAMDNPLGGIKRGWEEIQAVYQRIFKGQAKVYVEFYDYTISIFDEGCHPSPSGFVTVGRERGYVEVEEQRLELAIRTSRVYKRVNGIYKQVHHHGSIEDPILLKNYQELVR